MMILHEDGVGKTFQTFLNESVSVRIEHIEDQVLNAGYQGAVDAINYLYGIRQTLHGDGNSNVSVTVKWDGCVDPNTLIPTYEHGNITISEVIDLITKDQTVHVLQWDFKNEQPIFLAINAGQKQHSTKEWVDVQCENDHVIRLTSDHQVYTTNKGWIQAGELEEGDDILSC